MLSLEIPRCSCSELWYYNHNYNILFIFLSPSRNTSATAGAACSHAACTPPWQYECCVPPALRICMLMYVYECICICTCTCICMYAYICMYICTTHMHVLTRTPLRVPGSGHTHTHTLSLTHTPARAMPISSCGASSMRSCCPSTVRMAGSRGWCACVCVWVRVYTYHAAPLFEYVLTSRMCSVCVSECIYKPCPSSVSL